MMIIRDLYYRGNIVDPSTPMVRIEMWDYCIKYTRQPKGRFNYKLLERGIFGIYESSFDSSRDNDHLFPYYFLGKLIPLISSNSSKCLRVGDYEDVYTP